MLRDEEPKPFDYPRRIQLATIGHRVGVASLMGVRLSGIVPWWLWRTYYLGRLPRVERRLRVTLDWTSTLLPPRHRAVAGVDQAGRTADGAEPRRPTRRQITRSW